jgi:GT2 family glycosyltransferase
MPIPRISIVTPSFNQGQFLETCIRSVLDQGYPDLEYILIDAGSTDNSLEIIQRYQAVFAAWVSEPDRGQSDGINKGLRRASGQLVAWLNADDFLLPGALQAAAAAWAAAPRASFYYGDGLRVREDGSTKQKFFPARTPPFNLDAIIYGLNYILQPSTFINTEFLPQAGYLAEDLHYGLDTDLWIRLARLAPPYPIQAVLAASREWGSTKTSTGSFARIEELRRLAQHHSGQPLTPGVLCYLMDTLYHYAQEHPEIFPPEYLPEINRFWAASARLLEQYQALPDGVPMSPAEAAGRSVPGQAASPNRSFPARVRRKLHSLLSRIKRT